MPRSEVRVGTTRLSPADAHDHLLEFVGVPMDSSPRIRRFQARPPARPGRTASRPRAPRRDAARPTPSTRPTRSRPSAPPRGRSRARTRGRADTRRTRPRRGYSLRSGRPRTARPDERLEERPPAPRPDPPAGGVRDLPGERRRPGTSSVATRLASSPVNTVISASAASPDSDDGSPLPPSPTACTRP